MNTLPTAIKARFFTDKTEYLALRAHWSSLMNSERRHDLAAAHHLLYLVLTGRDWRKGFTPMSNHRKLENGNFAGWKLFKAFRELNSRLHEDWLLQPFDGLVLPETVRQIRQLLPTVQPDKYGPEEFSASDYPFSSYRVSQQMESLSTDEVEPMQ